MKVKQVGNDVVIYDVCEFDLGQTLECGQCFRFYKLKDNEYIVVAHHIMQRIEQRKELIKEKEQKLQHMIPEHDRITLLLKTVNKNAGIAPVKVEAVSSVGAGDSFGASWLTAMLGGASYGDAARLAAKVSAFVVSRTEAVPDYSISDFN